MTTYELLGIRIGSSPDIEIVSTDDKVVEWITEQIKKLSPTVKIEKDTNFHLRFYGMKYKQHSIGLWLVQQLCRDGWEPFGNIEVVRYIGFAQVTLRKAQEKST